MVFRNSWRAIAKQFQRCTVIDVGSLAVAEAARRSTALVRSRPRTTAQRGLSASVRAARLRDSRSASMAALGLSRLLLRLREFPDLAL